MGEIVATITLNKSSQTTIPKKIREMLGVELGDRLNLRTTTKKGELIISREPSLTERLDAIRERYWEQLSSGEQSDREQRLKHYKHMTVSEMRTEWEASPEAKAYYQEKYGVKTNA